MPDQAQESQPQTEQKPEETPKVSRTQLEKIWNGEVEGVLSGNDLITLHSAQSEHFESLWANGEENERFAMARHYSADQLKKIEAAHRSPISIPMIEHKYNTLLALQRANRTSYRVEARNDPNDEIKAELATIKMRDWEGICHFANIEDDVFPSGLGAAFGVSELFLDTDEMGNTIVNARELDYRNCVWDKNARTFEKKDGAFMAKLEGYYRFQIAEKYGKKVATEVVLGGFTNVGREKSSYFVRYDENGYSPLDVIYVITHYHKTHRKHYHVMFNDNQNMNGLGKQIVVAKYRRKIDADEKLRELQLPYLMAGIKPEGEVIAKTEERLDKYVFTYTTLLEYEETELEDFPFSLYFSFYYKDKSWTLIDLLKDPQKFNDKLFMQIDASIGLDVKGTKQMNVKNLADGESKESAVAKLNQPQEVIFTKSDAPAVQPVVTQGMKAEWFQLVTFFETLIEDLAGGASFEGLDKSQSKSGKAIEARAQLGRQLAFLFIDNMSRWKKDFGEKYLWWVAHFEDAERTVRVAGAALTKEMRAVLVQQGLFQESKTKPGTGYVTLNKEGYAQSYLKDANFELLVTEAQLSETDRQAKFQQMQGWLQLYGPQSVPPEVMAEFMDLDFTLKQKLINAAEQAQKMQQQLLATKVDQKQQEINVKKADVVRKGIE